jgi:hypothetical protein
MGLESHAPRKSAKREIPSIVRDLGTACSQQKMTHNHIAHNLLLCAARARNLDCTSTGATHLKSPRLAHARSETRHLSTARSWRWQLVERKVMSLSTRQGEQSGCRSDSVADHLNLIKESNLRSSRLRLFSLTLVLTSSVTFCSSGSLLIKPPRLLDCCQVVVFPPSLPIELRSPD